MCVVYILDDGNSRIWNDLLLQTVEYLVPRRDSWRKIGDFGQQRVWDRGILDDLLDLLEIGRGIGSSWLLHLVQLLLLLLLLLSLLLILLLSLILTLVLLM